MAYIPRLSKASAHAEVAQRYREKAKRTAARYPQSKPRTHAAIRIGELTRTFDDLWGQMFIPESDMGWQAVRVMAHHIGRLKDGPRRMSSWIQACAGWLPMGERERLISEVEECPLKWTADKLAWKFKITDAQRTRLKLTTIGAIDISKAERIKRRRIRNAEARRAARRAQGAKPRCEYEANSLNRRKPWQAAGMSRAAWYRAGKPTA